MRMLKVNRPEGLLWVRGRGVDGRSFYEYDVSGKVSMKALYERGKIRENDLKQFLAVFSDCGAGGGKLSSERTSDPSETGVYFL